MEIEEEPAGPSQQPAPSVEEDEAPDETEALLAEWGEARALRRKRPKFTLRSASHPGFFFTERARFQHVGTLVTCMRHFAATRDDAALAGVLATLLQAESPESISLKWQFRNKAAHARLSETLTTSFHLLKRHPGREGVDQLVRLLRRARPYQISDAGKAAVDLMVAQTLWEGGRASAAYDVLVGRSFPADSPSLALERQLMLAGIRQQQWAEAMRSAAAAGHGHAASQQQFLSHQHPQQLQLQIQHQLQLQLQQHWDPFSHSPAVWARAGRTARDLCGDAQGFLEGALQLEPTCTHAVMGLLEILLSQGKRTDAEALTRAHQSRTALDADAEAACVFISLSSSETSRRDAELAQRCCGLLQLDPTCGHAIQVLIGLAGEPASSAALLPTLMDGLCCFLEATPPVLRCEGVVRDAWEALAAAAVQLFDALDGAWRTAQIAKVALRTTQQAVSGCTDDVDGAAARWQRANAGLASALASCHVAQAALLRHEWWQQNHLRLSTSESEIVGWLQQGTADAATLTALAAVQSAQAAAVEAALARRVRMGMDAPTAEPQTAAYGDSMVAALRSFGEAHRAQQLRRALDVIAAGRYAAASAEESAVQSGAALTAASRGVDAVDGAPLGGFHPDLGFIQPLPAAWWTTFPQARRRVRKIGDEGEGGEEEAATPRLPGAGRGLLLVPPEEEQGNPLVESQPTQQRRVRFMLPGTQAADNDD